MAKGLIKGGFALYKKGREVTAQIGEVLEDAMAEIQAEHAEMQTANSSENDWEEETTSFMESGSGHLKPATAAEGGDKARQQGTA